MDVCLIYLPKPFLKQPDAQAPLGLMYLAAALEEKGKSVCIKNYASYSDEEAMTDLPEASLYGITATSLEVPQANDFAKLIKSKYQGAKVMLGGPGSYSHEFMDFDCIDGICMGEGEITIFDMLEDAERNTVQRFYTGEKIHDLDTLPLPARHLLKDKLGGDVFAYNGSYDGTHLSTVIIGTRGCPFKCSFCTAPILTQQNKLRYRSPKAIANEIRHVVQTYGIRQFRFSDDMFTANPKRVIEICKEIEKEEIFWRISCRVKPLTEDMLRAMWDSGCRELSFGIESFDDKVLKGLQKNTTAADNVRALELAADMGYKTRMLFMIRTPFQTPETIKLNKQFIGWVPYNVIACTAFIPIPGCDVWYNPDKYNIEILDKDINKYNFYMFGPEGRRKIDPIIKIKDRSLEEYHEESEEFRDWLEAEGKLNVG